MTDLQINVDPNAQTPDPGTPEGGTTVGDLNIQPADDPNIPADAPPADQQSMGSLFESMVSPEDRGRIEEHLAQTGQFPEGAKELIAEATGMPPHWLDTFEQGMRSAQQQHYDSLFQVAGGKERYQQMAEWARGYLSPAEAAEFNAAVNGTDPTVARGAVAQLALKYTHAVGTKPATVTGQPGATGGIEPFASEQEWQDAQSDPRYESSAAYRQSVDRRLALSDPKVLGVIQ